MKALSDISFSFVCQVETVSYFNAVLRVSNFWGGIFVDSADYDVCK